MQSICIDDAVVVGQDRAENVVTNDGTTMRTLVEQLHKPSAWSRLKEVLINPESGAAEGVKTEPTPAEDTAPATQPVMVEPATQNGVVEPATQNGVHVEDEADGAKELTDEEQLAEDKNRAGARAKKE